MSENPLEIAESRILSPAGIGRSDLESVLGTIMGHAVDNADLYFQVSRHESWSLEDSMVKEGHHNIEQGVGVRAMSGPKTGFAYSDEIVLPALTEASRAARAIARHGSQGSVQAWSAQLGHSLYMPADPIDTLKDEDKIALLQHVDEQTRRLDPRVKKVMAGLSGVHEIILVVGSDGTFSADVRPLVRFNVSVIVEENDRREQGYSGGGGRFAYGYFTKMIRPWSMRGRRSSRRCSIWKPAMRRRDR